MKPFIDRVIYLAAILNPVFNIPQFIKIMVNRSGEDVSILSWFGFSILSFIWLIYGIYHKDKPIIIMNLFLMIIQFLIAVSALIYS